jgi:hypothetical protein
MPIAKESAESIGRHKVRIPFGTPICGIASDGAALCQPIVLPPYTHAAMARLLCTRPPWPKCMRVCHVHGTIKCLHKLTATTPGSGFYY